MCMEDFYPGVAQPIREAPEGRSARNVQADAKEVPMAFPLIRLYTGADGQSHFEESTLELPKLEGTAHRSRSWHTTEVSFEESPSGSKLDWHRAPTRQYVITLSGTLEFETRL